MIITNYRKGGNMGGILSFANGTFEAFTATQTRRFKTLKAAANWLILNDYKPEL